jgi:hypothetical protein
MKSIITLAALAVVPGLLAAQEFRGAELSAEILSFDNDGDSLGQTTYRGSAEVGFGAVGVAADLSFYDFEDADGLRAVTVHGIYDAFSFATVGAFVVREDEDGESFGTIGLEAASQVGPLDVEGFASLSGGDADARALGLDASFDIGTQAALTGSARIVNGDGADFTRLAVGGEYRLGLGPTLYGEVGRLGADDGVADGSETFVGFGARIAIGPRGGTTFEPRGLNEALSGF